MKKKEYLVRAGKLVTVSQHHRTLYDGSFVVKDGKIIEVGQYPIVREKYPDLNVLDYSDYIITPSLVDCHTHVLEYAPSALFPVTENTHLMGGIALILKALSSGVTGLGEQICGHPNTDFKKEDYLRLIERIPIDIAFSLSTISIGLPELVHFSGITGSSIIDKSMLIDADTIKGLIVGSDYPGENIFINATPANFEDEYVPRAGEIIYTQNELNIITEEFHRNNKKTGCHVGGEEAIDMAINANFDVIHHGHGISEEQIQRVLLNNIIIVATPLGGTHLAPNSPEDIVNLVNEGVTVAISTDGYLPPSKKAPWLRFLDKELKGPESLMLIAYPAMEKLRDEGWNENDALKLITLNPAKVLQRDDYYGNIEEGKAANFLVSNGIPGLEITNPDDILQVFFNGERIINKN
ncbi:amidohydrolase family protein [Tissierella sp. Yu-01]|uniref:amidohydrolase family protein n=1 Tax=Tissierella sp. Yu-01 TaxID=3035694 RepID=UPI00240DD024|nr:amidohydrolase family protein [Tissierella sp. Yu-01]WFA08441.1 amidohydrolase family protein [Tissierella sp. Yu-01]